MTIADDLRTFAREDRDAECRPEDHIVWDGAAEIDRLVEANLKLRRCLANLALNLGLYGRPSDRELADMATMAREALNS